MTNALKMPRRRAVGLLALAFFAAARLSLLLAIPPGYATAVWPPAGVALGALWLWGVELWPGVLLGSFAANALTAWLRGAAGPMPYALAAWIGAGSAAQAAAAALLARRAIDGRDPLSGERDLFRFMILAGPVACLLASLWGTAGLLLSGTIGAPQALYSWATWWVGDSVGVVFAAPLILLWSGRGPAETRRGKATVTAAMFSALVVVLGINRLGARNEEQLARADAERRLADAATTLRTGLADGVDVVRSAADFFESRPGAGREEFGRFARAALSRHPSILALEWRPRVPDARRSAFEKSARASGLAGYAVTEAAAPGRVRPRARAPEYFPILYVEPRTGNEKVLGLDVGRDSPVGDALSAVLRTGKPAASGGVRLVQETGGEISVAILVPVKAPDASATVGVMEGVFHVSAAMRSLLAGSDSAVKGLLVQDVSDPAFPRLLYAQGVGPDPVPDAVQMTADVAGRRWRIDLFPQEDSPARDRGEQPWLVLVRELIMMYLTSWVVLTLYGRAERIATLVEQKTSELRENERRLMRAQRMESVGRLAGGIAHEFNNILMGASGLAQLVLLALGPEHPNAPDLEGIIGSTKRAGLLVSQLLTYSRRQETNKKPTDLDGLILRLSKMIAAAVGRRIELVADVRPEPLWIMADAAQVEQVVLNLCFNARDAISGKGSIRVSARPVLLESALNAALVPVQPGAYAALEVADDGQGIAPDVLPRLSEPFFTTKAFGEGSGLGLSVASGIVRAHGGGMDLRTTVGRGTAITVYWPATAAPPPDKTPPPAVSGPRGSGLILIVDDEPLVRPTLERILASYGYRTASAPGGEEALRVLESSPDVRGVVLDLMMPGMDGLETYDRILKLRPDVKVLFLSGFAPRASADEMERRGLPFLAKPADPARLAAALHEALNPPDA